MSTGELTEFELQRHAAVPASGDELGIVGVRLLLPAIARDLDSRPKDRPALISTVSRQSSTSQIAAPRRLANRPERSSEHTLAEALAAAGYGRCQRASVRTI
jgi:hypothetical protein